MSNDGPSVVTTPAGSPSTRFSERLQKAVESLRDSVESRPQVLGGVPVLTGTRFSVSQLLAELAEGENIDSIADDFEFEREKLSALLHAMAVCLNQPPTS